MGIAMIETSEVETPAIKTDNSFFLQWVVACMVGYAIGMPSGSLAGEKVGYSLWGTLVSIVGMPQEIRHYDYIFASALMGATIGGIISLSQWFVLRKYIQNAAWWVWIGLVCNLLGIAFNSVFPAKLSFNLYVPTILAALLTGYVERLVLKKSFPSRGWIRTRIAINTITLIIANINAAHYPVLIFNQIFNNTLMGLTSGFIAGVVSGLILNSFMNRVQLVLPSDV
jgi:hypothetical protein